MIKVYGFLLLILPAFAGSQLMAQADTSLNIIEKGKVQYLLSDGYAKLIGRNYRGALQDFREILRMEPSNALANFRVAETYYSVQKFDLALRYIEKVNTANLRDKYKKEYYLLRGQAMHRNGKIEEALEAFKQFKVLEKKASTLKESDVELYIVQCERAKKAMENPKDVTITSLSHNINSANPEYSAFISQDQKTMIFTARRPDTKGGGVDINYDNRYYEDIYIAHWDEEENDWGKSESVPGKLNTEFHDACLGFSADGNYIYIYRNIEGATLSGDIYVSKKSRSGKWGTPKPVSDDKKINSTYFESSASLTPDGTTMYFVSDRPKGKGMADIYKSEKIGDEWTEPENMDFNTEFDEKFVSIHPTGKLIFFSSEGHSSIGGHDIFVCKLQDDGTWGEPINLGYPINTVKEERTISVSQDGKTAYIGAFYDNSKGDSDIFKIDISSLGLLD